MWTSRMSFNISQTLKFITLTTTLPDFPPRIDVNK